MNFGEAIAAMKDGQCVQRAGWNGKNMHIYLEDGYVFAKGQPTERQYQPVIVMYTAQGTHQPGWLANQPDILSDDWQLCDTVEGKP